MQKQAGFRTLAPLRKFVIVVLLCLSYGAIGSGVWLDGYFCHNRPNGPEPQQGRVYRTFVCHGGLVYLTRIENLSLEALPLTGLVLFAAAAFLGQRWVRTTRLNNIVDRLPDCEVKQSNPRIHTNDHEQAAGKSQMKNGNDMWKSF
jgi:hypothetical protein